MAVRPLCVGMLACVGVLCVVAFAAAVDNKAGAIRAQARADVDAYRALVEGVENQPLALFDTSGPADKFKYTRAHPKESVQSAYTLETDMASLVFDRTKSSEQIKSLQDMYSCSIMMIDEANDELPEARIESHIVPKCVFSILCG